MASVDDIALGDAEAAGFDEPADLGSGTGTLSVLLAEAGYEVDGLDFSPRMVEGRWSNDAGLPAERTVELVEERGRPATSARLTDPAYCGRSIEDDRYLVASVPA